VWNELRLQRQLCDGILHSNYGKILHMHGKILYAESPYFKALFTDRLKGDEPEINAMNLDIPDHIIRDLIFDYVYTGHYNWIAPVVFVINIFTDRTENTVSSNFSFAMGGCLAIAQLLLTCFTGPYQATHVPSRDCCVATVLHATVLLKLWTV
jgi:hypothetical protein